MLAGSENDSVRNGMSVSLVEMDASSEQMKYRASLLSVSFCVSLCLKELGVQES